MSIQVTCPNGHVLQAKDALAGRVCLCPRCKTRVHVPDVAERRAVTESAILDILGRPEASARSLRDPVKPALETPRARTASPPKKACPHCDREMPVGHHICPFCQKYIAALTDF